MILVTGASGHIGNVLVRQLIEQHQKVRVFLQPCENTVSLSDLKVEEFFGDVRDIRSIRKAMEGINTVYHLAGMISICKTDSTLLEQINVMGTENVLRTSMEMKVRKVVHIASIHALEDIPHGGIITETTPFSPEKAIGAYGKSKARAALKVKQYAEQGLNAVIVCPTGVIGPYDYKPSRMGQLMINYNLGNFSAIPKNAYYDFVDVRDLADGIILAAKYGKAGEHYILSGERIAMMELLKQSGIFAIPKHVIRQVPNWLCKVGAALSPVYYRIKHSIPLFTKESIEILNSNCVISNAKAKNELNFKPRSLAVTIRDTVRWFVVQGMLPETVTG